MAVAKIISLGLLGAFAFSNFALSENLNKKLDFEARMNANFMGINFSD